MDLRDEKVVVYSCVTSAYDKIQVAPALEGLSFVLITDDASFATARGWSLRTLPPNAGRGAMANRFVKMHPDVLFQDYDVSVYVDGNIKVLGDILSFAGSAMSRGDIALFEHPFRNCIYSEAKECAAIGYDWHWKIRRQMGRYREDGYPEGNGLYEAGVMIRRHHSPAVRKLMAAWWQEYRNGVRRDQLSLPYLAWKLDVGIVSLGRSEVRAGGRHFALKDSHVPVAGVARRTRGWLNRKWQRVMSGKGLLNTMG